MADHRSQDCFNAAADDFGLSPGLQDPADMNRNQLLKLRDARLMSWFSGMRLKQNGPSSILAAQQSIVNVFCDCAVIRRQQTCPSNYIF
jgi:hypothetical protein